MNKKKCIKNPNLSGFQFGAINIIKKKLFAFVSIYRLSGASAHLMSYS